jgi:hypothetical protein
MDYDLLAAFDHPGVDPIAQAQAANLLSQQAQIRPPTLTGGAGIAEGRQEYISPQAPYVNPVNYAEQGGYPSNNQIAMDAFAAAQAAQQSQRTMGFEGSGMGGSLPETREPQRQVERYRAIRGGPVPMRFEDGSQTRYPGVGAQVRYPEGMTAYTNMAGNIIPPETFQSRWQDWQREYQAREAYRRASRMAAFTAPYSGFNPNAQLDPSQVGDARQFRRPMK